MVSALLSWSHWMRFWALSSDGLGFFLGVPIRGEPVRLGESISHREALPADYKSIKSPAMALKIPLALSKSGANQLACNTSL